MKNRNSQSVTPSECTTVKMFLNRPYCEGKVMPCGEEHFWKSINCKRVKLLNQMRKGDIGCNPEEFEGLKRNQPMFNFTNRYLADDDPRRNDGKYIAWNGRFLFSYHDAAFAQRVIEAHAEELGVILAFREPDYDRYWIVVDSHASDFSDDTAKKERIRVMRDLHRYFPRITPYGQWFFCRAVPEEYIDYIDEEALFYGVSRGVSNVVSTGFNKVSNGFNAEPSESPETKRQLETPETSEASETRSCRTMRLGEILDNMFGGIFKNRPAGCLR